MSDSQPSPVSARLSVVVRVLLLAVTAFLTAPALAAEGSNSVYDVTGVKVDVTAESAAVAREKALAEAEVKAFDQLLDLIVVDQDRSLMPRLDRQEISRYVRDFSVTEERTSSVRYLATLTYRFRPELVRGLLRERQVAYTETPSKPVLVLPVYRSANALYLWDEPKIGRASRREGWRRALRTEP